MSIENKNKKLGINYSTATSRLKKNLMYYLAVKCDLHHCYRCNEEIKNSEDLSVDHKIDWQNSSNPLELFWDLENLAFSHKSCNIVAGHDKKTINRNITFLKSKNKPYQVRVWNSVEKKQKLIGHFFTLEEAKLALDEYYKKISP